MVLRHKQRKQTEYKNEQVPKTWRMRQGPSLVQLQKTKRSDPQLSCSVRATAILEESTSLATILPVLQVFPMAQNEVEEFLLENMETPKRLAESMVSARDGSASHPCRGRRRFLLHPALLQNVSSSGGAKSLKCRIT